ncbi:hypothetical protein JCM11641_005802 [Rhodosporidiobolus odoratus]
MQESTLLLATLLPIFGTILLLLSLAFFRFAYRKHKRGRAIPVDPNYEVTQVELPTDGGRVRWFGGAYGVTPVAEAGPGGTKQYLSGWFGLDAPSGSGWSRSNADGSFTTPSPNSPSGTLSTWRDSHFSRASRASRRAALAADRKGKGKDESGSSGSRMDKKKKPRVSRTTELGVLEKEDGGLLSQEDEQGDEKVGAKHGVEVAQR